MINQFMTEINSLIVSNGYSQLPGFGIRNISPHINQVVETRPIEVMKPIDINKLNLTNSQVEKILTPNTQGKYLNLNKINFRDLNSRTNN
jgi:hypothetical protein